MPVFGFTLRNEPSHTVFADLVAWTHGPTGRFEAGRAVTVRVEFDNLLAPSRYKLTPSVARAGRGGDALDLREDFASIMLHGRAHRRRRRPAPRLRDRARMSARQPPAPPAAPVRARRGPAPLRQPHLHARGRPTSSCASSARRWATLWTLMRPLLFFGVLYLVFTQVVALGDGSSTTRSTPAVDHPVQLLRGDVTAQRAARGRTARTCCARSASRGSSSRSRSRSTALFNLGMNAVARARSSRSSPASTPRWSWLSCRC